MDDACAFELEALARLDAARTVLDVALTGDRMWLDADVVAQTARLVAAGGRFLESATAA